MKTVLAIFAYTALIPLLFLLVRQAANRWNLAPEVRRKFVHVGLGLATLTFPLVFEEEGWWAVAVICLIAIVMLITIRVRESRSVDGLTREKSILHGVGRTSAGELWFPVSVAVVYALARGEWIFFYVPILILTLADAIGALAGTRYHSDATVFSSLSGWKSVEGSGMFFFTAFFSAHVPLLLFTQTGRAESLLIAAILGLVIMMIEAISTRGLDNLLVPVASALLLREYLDLDTTQMLWRLLLIAALLTFVLISKRFTSLEGGALLAAVLFGYGCSTLGDWRFALPPVILFIEHLTVTSRMNRIETPHHNLWPVLSIATSLLPWPAAATLWPEHTDLFLACFTAGTAIHLAILNLSTRVFIAGTSPTLRMRIRSLVKAILLIAVPGAWLVTPSPWLWIAITTAGFLSSGVCLEVFIRGLGSPTRIPNQPSRWIFQALLVLGGGAAIAWPLARAIPLAP